MSFWPSKKSFLEIFSIICAALVETVYKGKPLKILASATEVPSRQEFDNVQKLVRVHLSFLITFKSKRC